jgi:hypothetical protein
MFLELASLFEGQIRVGAAGFAGLDIPACVSVLQAHGMDPDISALLLPCWEEGMFAARAELREKEEG